MAWYYGTYSCGHEGRINIIGPTKDSQRKADYHFSGLCTECYEKERKKRIEEENKKASEEAVEMELPELSGTENQVPWANTLRHKFIKDAEHIIELTLDSSMYQIEAVRRLKDCGIKEVPNRKEVSWFIEEILQYSLIEKTTASYWINNYQLKDIFEIIVKLANERREKNNDIPKSILAESTVAPDEVTHRGIVNIVGDDTCIKAYYEKEEDFRAIVKKHDYTWDGVWKRKLNEFTGSFSDRAAELGNDLLHNGYMIQILDPEIRQKAISGSFQPECRRWIKYISTNKKLALKWPKKDKGTDIYENSLKIPGARWSSEYSAVLVKVEYFREVMDFADCYGFHFSKQAQAFMDQYAQEELKIDKVKPGSPVEDMEVDKLKEKLKSSGAILTDLMDGD